MLQQILKDMYIDPEVLDALNEEQKKTLFLKMRQEQVRRWKEREEKLEREGGDAEHRRTKPKKANSKSVSWLLGRDGDVAVIVIGEVDELSSKFICSGLGEKKAPSLQNNTYHRTILKCKKTTEAVRTERENLPPKAQPGISLNLKGKREETSTLLPLPVSVSEQSSPPAAEKQAEPKPAAAAAAEEKPAPQPAVCSRPPMRTSPVNVRPACANVVPGSVNARPGFANLRQAAAVATTSAISAAVATSATAAAAASSPATPSPAPSGATKTDSGTTSLVKGGVNSLEPPKPRDSQGVRDTAASEASGRAASEEAVSSGRAAACAGRGRVAQLMKTFSTESSSASAHSPPRGVKPPLPTKPSHLRAATTPSVR